MRPFRPTWPSSALFATSSATGTEFSLRKWWIKLLCEFTQLQPKKSGSVATNRGRYRFTNEDGLPWKPPKSGQKFTLWQSKRWLVTGSYGITMDPYQRSPKLELPDTSSRYQRQKVRYFYLGEEILAALPMAAIKLVSGAAVVTWSSLVSSTPHLREYTLYG